jgi:hypothetical protein
MAEKSASKQGRTEAQIREDRLKAALKANMGRRKAQARARQDDAQSKQAEDE